MRRPNEDDNSHEPNKRFHSGIGNRATAPSPPGVNEQNRSNLPSVVLDHIPPRIEMNVNPQQLNGYPRNNIAGPSGQQAYSIQTRSQTSGNRGTAPSATGTAPPTKDNSMDTS